jgi:hypothetical protein
MRMRHESMAETRSVTIARTVAVVSRSHAWSWEHSRARSRIRRWPGLGRRLGHGWVLQVALVAFIGNLRKVFPVRMRE